MTDGSFNPPAELLRGEPFEAMMKARRERAEFVAALAADGWHAAGAALRQITAWIREQYARHATFAELSQMTDRELQDIGIVRSSIATIAAGNGANENRSSGEHAA